MSNNDRGVNKIIKGGDDHLSELFSELLLTAAKLPGVHIDRAEYLKGTLKNICTDEEIERAVFTTPAAAGISREILDKAAKDSIILETIKVTALSAAAGIPGGVATVATVPADMAQHLGHMLRVSQKLAYIYSWPDLFESGPEEVDDGTQAMLTLFVGVMVSAHSASAVVGRVSEMISNQAVKKLPRQALTKGVIYPAVKKVARILGAKMTKQIFANWVPKAVPVFGAAVSGGITLATFAPMSNRLKTHLAELDLARPVLSAGKPGATTD